MTPDHAPCPRCGVPRVVNPNRVTGHCRDCRATDPRWPYDTANANAERELENA